MSKLLAQVGLELGEQGLLVELDQERDVTLDREAVLEHPATGGHFRESGPPQLAGRSFD